MTMIAPSIEVLNYGVKAYGLDQAYLRYLRIGTDFNPHIVFIGYMSENIARDVNVFRPFYTQWYRDEIFTKPRFKVRDGRLMLLENPLSTIEDYARLLNNDKEVLAELGENDHHYQSNYTRGAFDVLPSVRFAKVFGQRINSRLVDPIFKPSGMYSTTSEAYEVTVEIFGAFYQEVLENGALPIILVFPDGNDQYRNRRGYERRYAPLLAGFHSRENRFIDALEALEPYESQYTVDALVENWGHFSALGNRLVAEHIVNRLEAWGLTDSSRVDQAIETECRRLGLVVQ